MSDKSLSKSLKGFFKHSKSRSGSPEANGSPQSAHDEQFKPQLTTINLNGYQENTKHRLLSSELAEEIRTLLPARLKIQHEWQLLYSLEQHGSSLNTLYNNSKPSSKYDRNGYVLVVKDQVGTLFGCYVNEYFHTTDSRRYFGNGECFLWKSRDLHSAGGEGIQFQAFPYTGLNDFVMYCTFEFLSLGGGDGHYGLWIDQDLLHGVSDRSLTFGNEPLSEQGTKFGILGVEVWRVGA